ncbi:MAG: hypothetical protein NTX49_04560 [Chlamydiae bacterium]|nr:hypothetical protein [Chlamydiota bacterium]
MSALTPSDSSQRQAQIITPTLRKVSDLFSDADLDARVAASAQGAIYSPAAASVDSSYMSQESLASLLAGYGLNLGSQRERVVAREASSEERRWVHAYEGVPASSISAAAASKKEVRYPVEVHSEEWSLAGFAQSLKGWEGEVQNQKLRRSESAKALVSRPRLPLSIEREAEARKIKARQLEQSRQPEPDSLPRFKSAPISPLVPIDAREGFKRSLFNRVACATGPSIQLQEMFSGGREPSELLKQKLKFTAKCW